MDLVRLGNDEGCDARHLDLDRTHVLRVERRNCHGPMVDKDRLESNRSPCSTLTVRTKSCASPTAAGRRSLRNN